MLFNFIAEFFYNEDKYWGKNYKEFDYYHRALEYNPKNCYAYFNLGWMFSQKENKNTEKAIDFYKKSALLGNKEAVK